jgi:hypothetical protein
LNGQREDSEMGELIGHTFEPLRVEERAGELAVSGTTFRLRFSTANGLITSVRILGRQWLAGRPVPDLWASPEVDPRGHEWEAARERKAEVRVREAAPERVVIEARGRYLSRGGKALPLRYHVTYTIECDGVVRVDVEQRGTGRGELRWLVFSSAAVKRGLVDFYSHVGDLAMSERTGEWVTEVLPQRGRSERLLGARFLPWLQLGNDTSGLDLTVEDAEGLSHGWTDSEPVADPLGESGRNFVLEADERRVRWSYFSIRNLYTSLRAGWRRCNRFYLAPVPAKEYSPRLWDLRVHWMGPHQIEPGFVYPTDEEIAGLARRGINLLIGCANWRSGEYSRPENARETRRVIAACHRNGIRIIPYITFTDLNHRTAAFRAHGEDWQIEPVAEFKHLTNLMCYGAEGWREHWKREVDTILDRFDFDGLYIDFWVGKMACRNTRHGCGVKYPRFTLPGVREMAWHAFRRVREKGAGRFILANTNLFAGALVNNLVDVRLPGEWANIEETPPALVRSHLNSRRLGCNALLLTGPVRELGLRSASFSLRCQSPMVMAYGSARGADRRARAEPEGVLMRYADMLRFFGVGQARCQGAWQPDESLSWPGEEATLYWCRSQRGAIVVVANLSQKRTRGRLRIAKPARLGVSGRKRYLVYRVDRGELMENMPVPASRLRSLKLALRPYEPALIHMTPAKRRPQPLWATLSDGFEEERYRARAGHLSFIARGAQGGRCRVTVFAGSARLSSCEQGGRPLAVRRRGPLAVFEATCNETVDMRCGPAR